MTILFILTLFLLTCSKASEATLLSKNKSKIVVNYLSPGDYMKYEMLQKNLPKVSPYQNVKTEACPENRDSRWGFFKNVETGKLFLEDRLKIIPDYAASLIDAQDPTSFNIEYYCQTCACGRNPEVRNPYMKCISSCFDLQPLLESRLREGDIKRHEADFLFEINVQPNKQAQDFIKAKDSIGLALHSSTSGNLVELTKGLIKYGADVNVKNDSGETALICAIYLNSVQTAKVLIDAGADVNIKYDGGTTALFLASSFNIDIFKLLIDAKADLNEKCDAGYTVVTKVLLSPLGNKVEIVKLLVDAGADLSVKDTYGSTAFDHAETFQMKILTSSKRMKVNFLMNFLALLATYFASRFFERCVVLNVSFGISFFLLSIFFLSIFPANKVRKLNRDVYTHTGVRGFVLIAVSFISIFIFMVL